MANNEGFYSLQAQSLFLLWIIAVMNCLEIVLCMAHILELSGDFWDKFSVFFYIVWSICGVVASGSGIYGIEKNIPDLLEKPVWYFLGSAILKGIFTAALLISPSSAHKFNMIIAYASGGPLLLTLIDRFTNNFAPLPISLNHMFVIVFLLCMAFIVKHYRKAAMKRNENHGENEHDEIQMQ